MIYSRIEKSHQVCLNIEAKSILINKRIFKKCYSQIPKYVMLDNKRLRCKKVEGSVTFNFCATILLRFKDDRGFFNIISTKTHLVLDLSCDMIIEVKLMKFNRMIIEWDNANDDQNHMIWEGKKFSIKAISISILLISQEKASTSMFIIKTSFIELIKRTHLKIPTITIYIVETTLLKSNYEKNVIIQHQFFSNRKSYLFEFILRINSIIDKFVISMIAIIKFNQIAISMSNFELTFFKILKEQTLKKINVFFNNA